MKQITKYIAVLLLALLSYIPAQSQGCVAIRQFSTCSGNTLEANQLNGGSWQIGANYRYFKSFRHYRGTHEEPDRVANNSEVVNHAHAWDFSVSYAVTNRLYTNFVVPYVINTRSSLYEHGREERNTTFSRGLGDVRLGVGYWLLSPEKNPAGNMAIGVGVKLPTGDFQATDIFYNVGVDGSPQVRPVDQSIQPGDGGFGVAFDWQGYRALTSKLFAFGSAFYLINPRETNGVRTFRDSLSPILANEAIMSVPDQFGLRAGLSYQIPALKGGVNLAARYEGIPVEDLIGGSEGFRRPGTVLSIEPGYSFHSGNWMVNLSVPVALRRERPQSVTDLETQIMTGKPRHGDSAFADYLINVGIIYRIPVNNSDHSMDF